MTTVVCTEGQIQDEARIYPGVLLGNIAFPVHQILETMAPRVTVQDLAHSVGQPAVDDLRGQWGGDQRRGGVRLEWDMWNTGWTLREDGFCN